MGYFLLQVQWYLKVMNCHITLFWSMEGKDILYWTKNINGLKRALKKPSVSSGMEQPLLNVTRYSKRYLTALPTSYWFCINTFSHKRAAVFSSQEVHDLIGCKLWPQMYTYQPQLIMLCIDKRSMVQAQYCSEWTELWYGTLQGSIPLFRDDRTRVASVSSSSSIYYWSASNNCKSDTSGSDLRYLLL